MTIALKSTSPAPGVVTDPIRVMVVDDSVVVRGLIGRWIDEDPSLAVVASHRNGKLAVDDIARVMPDVVVLDIEMPEMDGLTALPLLLAKKPDLIVVMASSLTRRNAEVSLKALSLGATDYVPKPDSNSGISTSPEFKRELVEKVKALGLRARSRGGRPIAPRPTPVTPAPAPQTASTASAPSTQPAATATRPFQPPPAGKTITTRPYGSAVPRILAIGSSTGGPQALTKLFQAIGPSIGRVPVVVTQHMPATFTAILAEHIAKASGRPAAEGRHGERLEPGRVYVAPGGKHMVITKSGADPVIELNDLPPVNFCKPAVDPLFDSVSAVYGAAVLAVVLTGMGSDGANGARMIAGAGGSIIAQDEETSVVWGMPGAVAHAGVASEILALDAIGPKVMRILSGGRP